MNRAKQLLQLQEIEDDLREKLTLLKKVQAALSDSPALRQARDVHGAAAAAHAGSRSVQRDLELELQELDEKIKRETERLYGGTVKNPKELENIRKEVESLQRRRADLDERALEGMEQVERAGDAVAEAQRALAVAEAEWRDQQGDLSEKEQKLKRYINARRRQREATLTHIPPADLARLRDIQARKGGKGAAPLRDGTICGLCGVSVSASKLAHIHGGAELVLCGNCGRILVA